MFVNGAIRREVFIEHINNNGAIWADTDFKMLNKMKYPIHTYISSDGNSRVIMPMPFEDIPKETALVWLRQLKLR